MNDYRRRALGEDPSRLIAFICECAAADCHRTVLLRARDYDTRTRNDEPVVIEDHLRPGHSAD